MGVLSADHSKISLVVRHAFGPYERGDEITDLAEVKKWSASHPEYVVAKAYDRTDEGPAEEPEAAAPEPGL